MPKMQGHLPRNERETADDNQGPMPHSMVGRSHSDQIGHRPANISCSWWYLARVGQFLLDSYRDSRTSTPPVVILPGVDATARSSPHEFVLHLGRDLPHCHLLHIRIGSHLSRDSAVGNVVGDHAVYADSICALSRS